MSTASRARQAARGKFREREHSLGKRRFQVEIVEAKPEAKIRTRTDDVYIGDEHGSLHKLRYWLLENPILTPSHLFNHTQADRKANKRPAWIIRDGEREFITRNPKHAEKIRQCIEKGWAAVLDYCRANCRCWVMTVEVK